ncbi:MFS general substrate transporter [Penicillium taxi]|uniref:MFS general substrate transporter n=1 Tax=Penicillium taxi TaxID=168475 RepID=UPI0025457B36|nr:MFS general substrate transporter [Penicillium taxi]KAJ5894572.1 MFS general substrate transporter [Penicillium taxi]
MASIYRNEPDESIQKSASAFRKWLRVFAWYPSSYSKKERRLLIKLDLFVLLYCCMNFFTKYLDQTNVTNAYVSGMKEDLNMQGDELNLFTTFYVIGYVISQVPGVLLLTRNAAPYVLPVCELVWAILTLCQSRVTKVQHMYAIRFLIGFAEGPTFPGIHFILGSWYKKEEIHKRAGIYFVSSCLGTMTAGYLQSAAYKHLSGVNGYKGWQWQFLIDGIFTLPIAVAGLLLFPGIPSNPKKFYFTEEIDPQEYALSSSRLERKDEKKPNATKIEWALLKRVFLRWHWWFFVILWSVPQINNLPTITTGITLISGFLGASMIDIFPKEPIVLTIQLLMLFSNICLSVWNIPDGLRFFCYFITGIGGPISPIFNSWANDVCRNDAEERAVVLASMNTIGYSFLAWVPLLIWPTTLAPKYRVGFITNNVFVVLAAITFIIGTILDRKEKKKQRLSARDSDDEDQTIAVVSPDVKGQTA